MNRPTAAPPVFPLPGHRTVAETDKPRVLRAAARHAQFDRVLALKADGLTTAQIGERMGLCVSRISQILAKARQHRAEV